MPPTSSQNSRNMCHASHGALLVACDLWFRNLFMHKQFRRLAGGSGLACHGTPVARTLYHPAADGLSEE